MNKKAVGLNEKGIEIGLYKQDGTAPVEADFKTWGKCYKDTATLETAEGETVSCECEEDDDPEDEIYIPGATTLKFSTSDLDPATCHEVFGGTLVEGEWTAPDRFEPKMASVRFTTRTGKKVLLAKVKIATRINWAIKKNGYGLLEHTCKKLAGKFSIAETAQDQPVVQQAMAPMSAKSSKSGSAPVE